MFVSAVCFLFLLTIFIWEWHGYPKKSIPSPQRNAFYAGCTWLNSLQHRYIETMTYENQSSSFLECFPTILEFDWLTKRATARVTPAFACPETSANRFSNTSMRRKRNFSFPKRTLWSKGKHQRWNKRPSYSLKRQVFFSFYSQHCFPRFDGFRVVFLEVLTRRLTGYSFRVLSSNFIQFSFTYDDIWLSETVRQTKTLQRCHTYIPGRTSVRLGRKHVPKVTMLLVIHDSYRFIS